MTYYTPPHEVRDDAKLASMINTLTNGGNLPPILVCGEAAFNGSHRIAAWRAVGMDAIVQDITDTDYCTIMTTMGMDPIYDTLTEYDDFISVAINCGFYFGA